jgi:hypothetical protein
MDLPPECGGGTLFSDLARLILRCPARRAVAGLLLALIAVLLAVFNLCLPFSLVLGASNG